MAIREISQIDTMSGAELEAALGVPGASTDWHILGELIIKYRIGIYPTEGWGSGNGVANIPGWKGTVGSLGGVVTDTNPLLAACRALLFKLSTRHWNAHGQELRWNKNSSRWVLKDDKYVGGLVSEEDKE